MSPSTRRKAPAVALRADVDNAPTQVLRQFRQIFNAVKTHFRQVELQAGIGGAQVWALGLIKEHAGIGVSELARCMDVHQSTASNLVKALVDKELVSVVKDEVDRRGVRLRIKAAGTRLLSVAPGPFVGLLPSALASIDPRVLERLQSDLAVVIVALKAEDADPQKLLSEL